MNTQRPVNLDLQTVRMPITAAASILHRITAVISWVGMAFLLVVLCFALGSQESYSKLAAAYESSFLLQFFSWGFLTAFGYYCMGTLKHIIQDFGFFEDFEGGKLISWAAIGAGILLSLLAGILVW